MNRRMLSLLIDDFHKELDHQIQYLVSGETTMEQYETVLNSVLESFGDETKITLYGFSSLHKGGRIIKFFRTKLYAPESLAMKQSYDVFGCYKVSCQSVIKEQLSNKDVLMARILYFINSESETHSAASVASCFNDTSHAAWPFISKVSDGYFSVRRSTELCLTYLMDELYINPRFKLKSLIAELFSYGEFHFFFQNNLKILENKWHFMYVICSFLEEFMPHIYVPNRSVVNYEHHLADTLTKFAVDSE